MTMLTTTDHVETPDCALSVVMTGPIEETAGFIQLIQKNVQDGGLALTQMARDLVLTHVGRTSEGRCGTCNRLNHEDYFMAAPIFGHLASEVTVDVCSRPAVLTANLEVEGDPGFETLWDLMAIFSAHFRKSIFSIDHDEFDCMYRDGLHLAEDGSVV